MATLYDLTEAYVQLMADLESCESKEEADRVMDAVEKINDDIGTKAEAYARLMRNLKADSEAYDAEIKRLTARKSATENAIKRLMDHLAFAMGIAGASELKTSIGKFSIVKNPWSVKVANESEIPEAFLIPQPPKVDKTAILRQYNESGEIVKGVDIVRTEGVRFR